ncbi:MAG TPA: 1-deoxy-D-xylulose-5-phosphate reductoisomerase [Candidatus Aphodoplasma excrementigallinarum]|uniref:1-deoxy-D-xylulose 5-phosphate reductoisomerase n=1 Tax=Candidatus Aphodoplasma excrementigallinarum TaxID=2840673 RepID=A0A9D1NGA1_9FIRM|nr:1-deoxy-D-xylulose-5-phosphate reductoisomerase [Candidatus Aphodoplasma excrementigallinarum]
MEHNIAILGSTGSIGAQSLDVIRQSPDLHVLGLSANHNIELLEVQAREFLPRLVCVCDEDKAKELKVRLADTNIRVVSGPEGMCELAALDGADTVLTAVMGIAGLSPTVAAIKSGKNIALANKETLVAAGELVTALAREHGVSLLPVDSEHSAVFQSLAGLREKKQLKKIILTASGGPFYGKRREELSVVTPEMALRHPNWDMGAKITIDSSTLVNKGLEVIEARWLFDVAPDEIDVVVHPQSIIHSMVEYIDGSVIAQLGLPDMRLPIAYALTYPDRVPLRGEALDLAKIGTLTFAEPDTAVFPALPLAYEALRAGGTMCAVYNGADEAAVELFMQRRIDYLDIASVIEGAMRAYTNTKADTLDAVLDADRWARDYVYSKV